MVVKTRDRDSNAGELLIQREHTGEYRDSESWSEYGADSRGIQTGRSG